MQKLLGVPGAGNQAQEFRKGGSRQDQQPGLSILKANVELEVAEALAEHVDAKGVPSVTKVSMPKVCPV